MKAMALIDYDLICTHPYHPAADITPGTLQVEAGFAYFAKCCLLPAGLFPFYGLVVKSYTRMVVLTVSGVKSGVNTDMRYLWVTFKSRCK